MKETIYDYSVLRVDGSEKSLRDYEGKVIMVVNTATGCGFTPHYKNIQEMYDKYHDKGLEIVDIPCNQFAGQTPGTDEEIHQFCTLKYNTTFEQMKKCDVNGDEASPVYEFLKEKAPFEGFGKGPFSLAMASMMLAKDKNYKSNPDIKWNFTIFVVGRDGKSVKRFEPTVNMKKVDEYVASVI